MKLAQLVTACAIAGALSVGTAHAQADNTNSKTAPRFNTWMTDYSKANNGRISRQAYMDEAGKRWDAMDTSKQGLTETQINQMYGYNSGAATPAMVKRGNSGTNPTGTEPKGENSGGK
jgi:hypothetical protein